MEHIGNPNDGLDACDMRITLHATTKNYADMQLYATDHLVAGTGNFHRGGWGKKKGKKKKPKKSKKGQKSTPHTFNGVYEGILAWYGLENSTTLTPTSTIIYEHIFTLYQLTGDPSSDNWSNIYGGTNVYFCVNPNNFTEPSNPALNGPPEPMLGSSYGDTLSMVEEIDSLAMQFDFVARDDGDCLNVRAEGVNALATATGTVCPIVSPECSEFEGIWAGEGIYYYYDGDQEPQPTNVTQVLNVTAIGVCNFIVEGIWACPHPDCTINFSLGAALGNQLTFSETDDSPLFENNIIFTLNPYNQSEAALQGSARGWATSTTMQFARVGGPDIYG